jgi:hypothetical protein
MLFLQALIYLEEQQPVKATAEIQLIDKNLLQ